MAFILAIVMFLVIGLVAGAIASFYMGQQQDLWMNLLFGVIGALVGGFLAHLLGLTAFNVVGEIVVATLGAIVCIYVWQRLKGA
jgi:uncharacterized membrane protein YeaQ/YmgE (transglycosylase-associated protein family)